jgi:hypothetical protein
MLLNSQNSVFRSDLDIDTSNAFPPPSRNWIKALIYMVSPEDTAQSGVERHGSMERFDGNPIKGAIKAMFWIAVSILIALLMGQLS